MRHTCSTLTILSSVLAGALAVGCGAAEDGDKTLDGAPELAAVEMRLTGDPESEGIATENDAIDAETLATDELETLSTDPKGAADPDDRGIAGDLGSARAAVRELNESLREALVPIVAMVRDREPDKTIGNASIWGPVERGATEYRFLLRRTAPRRFGWRLEARTVQDDSAYELVAAGHVQVGERARRGVGAAGFDLDALGSVDPTVIARGRILVGFAHGSRGTTVRYALKSFSRSGQTDGIDALLGQVRLEGGVHRLRLAYHGNVDGTETSAEELVLARVRHTRGQGGRSDAIVTGGDVPASEVRIISECWEPGLGSVYRIVRICPGDGIGGERCTVSSSEGDVASCPGPFVNAELPPALAVGPMVDDQDPNAEVEAPDEVPEVEGVAD